jgi:hypothetical protein
MGSVDSSGSDLIKKVIKVYVVYVFLLVMFFLFIFFFNTEKLMFIIFEIVPLIFYFVVVFLIWYNYGRDLSKKDVGYLSTFELEPSEKIDPIFASYFLEGKFPQKTWFLTGVLSLISKKVYSIENTS